MATTEQHNPEGPQPVESRIGRYLLLFSKRVVGCFAGVAGCTWGILQLLEWFNVSLNYIKQLGSLGLYAYLASIAILALAIAALWTLFEAGSDLVTLNKQLQSEQSDSESGFSRELLNSVQKLFHDRKYADVVRLCEVLSRPLWITGRYRERS